MQGNSLSSAIPLQSPGLAPAGFAASPVNEVPQDLLPGALDLLRITADAWGPLREDDAAPMPLAVRKKLKALREDYRRSAGRGYIDAENQEWMALPVRWRMALLLLCGVEGDLPTLASRDIQSMPPPERGAIKSELRLAKRHFARLVALVSLW